MVGFFKMDKIDQKDGTHGGTHFGSFNVHIFNLMIR